MNARALSGCCPITSDTAHPLECIMGNAIPSKTGLELSDVGLKFSDHRPEIGGFTESVPTSLPPAIKR